jgi:hypothetical protein
LRIEIGEWNLSLLLVGSIDSQVGLLVRDTASDRHRAQELTTLCTSVAVLQFAAPLDRGYVRGGRQVI